MKANRAKYIGKQYGRLTVSSVHSYRADGDYNKKTRLWAISNCVCGGVAFCPVNNLTRGHTKSCGCLNSELMHIKNYKHGGTYTPTFTSWKCMKQRCLYPTDVNYENYGGRGIKISPRWLGDDGFKNFLHDMGERPAGKTLDRKNVNGNYCKSNCRWATQSEQNRNKRRVNVSEQAHT